MTMTTEFKSVTLPVADHDRALRARLVYLEATATVGEEA
jgi:hypothetical protein